MAWWQPCGSRRVHDTGTRVVQYHLRVAPRLWLLKRRRRTRIFQGLRVTEIVDAVLREAGIATRWQLLRDYPVREYCTQYEESDLHFVKRLCAEAGVYFYFPQGPSLDASAAAESLVPGDTVIFADDASFYPPIAGDDPAALAATPSPTGAVATAGDAPTLYFMAMQDTAASHLDKVTHFSLRTVVKAGSAVYRDYDPQRPQARISSATSSTAPFPAPDPAGGPARGRSPSRSTITTASSSSRAGASTRTRPRSCSARSAAARRRRTARAAARTCLPGIASRSPTTRRRTSIAPTLTSVDHHGFARPSAISKQKIYWNVFTCVPAEVTFVPPRPQRKSVQVALTATVVGPPGEDIHVDAMGQIKVQFHWDREGGDGEGKLTFSAPITTRELRIVLKNYGAFELGIGEMDPISELTGVQKRLANLGHFWEAPDGELDDDSRDGIMRFQRASGLEMTGELTADTLAALEKAHAC